jgi:glycosyltransferase involved in cell wall biosynthesis
VSESPAKNPNSTIRVLLWSPGGAGEHYHGPGSFAYRLYSTAQHGRFQLTLAHGVAAQAAYPLFQHQQLIHPLTRSPLSLWRFLNQSRRWLNNHAAQFDVFHGLAAYQTTVQPAYAAQRLGLPSVVFVANHRVELTDKPGLKGILGLPRRRRAMVKQISGLIAMSEAIYEELRRFDIPERRIARIPMAVDTSRFRPPVDAVERQALREQLGWPDKPTLIFVGGVTKRKRPHLLIEAIGLLHKRGLECQLAIVGPDHEPPYTERMKHRARELRIESQVIWFGFTKDIGPLFRASDFFGLPSANEGMPAALVEAMASGIPSIVTAISGTTDLVVDGQHGRIVAADPAEIADALAHYLKNPEGARLQGQKARDRVLRQYSTTVVLEAYQRLFRRVMAGGDAVE